MITYDYNFVNIDFYLEYRITDPVAFASSLSGQIEGAETRINTLVLYMSA